mmetsp:Transcript_107944/g.170352  ORF Transcript_107944/g.170352 Transcript_107944/m.170352 type:complete len:277 (-) Transcript_107944:128-958(-)
MKMRAHFALGITPQLFWFCFTQRVSWYESPQPYLDDVYQHSVEVGQSATSLTSLLLTLNPLIRSQGSRAKRAHALMQDVVPSSQTNSRSARMVRRSFLDTLTQSGLAIVVGSFLAADEAAAATSPAEIKIDNATLVGLGSVSLAAATIYSARNAAESKKESEDLRAKQMEAEGKLAAERKERLKRKQIYGAEKEELQAKLEAAASPIEDLVAKLSKIEDLIPSEEELKETREKYIEAQSLVKRLKSELASQKRLKEDKKPGKLRRLWRTIRGKRDQ